MLCTDKGKFLCNDDNCDKCFQRSVASNPKSCFWSNKNSLSARQTWKTSNSKGIFECECGFTVEIIVRHFIRFDNFCPHCSDVSRICNDETCQICFSRSISSHEKSKYWSFKNNVKPRQVFKKSAKKYWFDCECGHSFQSSPVYISRGVWCPYCSSPIKKLCENENCDQCFKNSFGSHGKSIFWSKRNNLSARQVIKHSNKKYWFDCSCGHEIYITISGIVGRDNFCPYCSSHKLCDDENCLQCFNKSFASSLKSNFFSEKNLLKPRQIFKYTAEIFIFNCKNGHEFLSCPNHDSGCPKCYNKTEGLLSEWLKENNYQFTYQTIFQWCKNLKCLPYDFLIVEFHLLIEMDGRQHFFQVKNWISPEGNHKNDLFKINKALENKYTIIHILQENIWKDKNDWQNKLKKYLHKYEKPTCVFINRTTEYNKLIKDMEKIQKLEEYEFEIICDNNESGEETLIEEDLEEFIEEDLEEFIEEDLEEFIEEDLEEFIEEDLEEFIEEDLEEFIEEEFIEKFTEEEKEQEIRQIMKEGEELERRKLKKLRKKLKQKIN